MAVIDQTFRDLCRTILTEGKEYENKNRGVKRLQIPSYTLRHDFNNGFPAISTKELKFKQVVGELIWFLRGDNDVKYLNDNGIKIWNKDAYNWYQKEGGTLDFKEFQKRGTGSVGQNYSVQWRNYNGNTDQIENLIEDMQKDIMSSRLKVNAWNPSEINDTALPPCHSEFQVIGVPLENDKFGFELHWNQRSVDTFLGLPFNIASYALLAKILEYLTGYKAIGIEGTLKCVHFYDNQYEAAEEIAFKRDPDLCENCELGFFENDEETYGLEADYLYSGLDYALSQLKIEQFQLKGYEHQGAMPVKMLAPKEV